MAFKLRSQIQGSLPLHSSGQGSFKKNPFSNKISPLSAIDPTKKLEEKPNTRTETTTTSDWRNTGEPVVARRPGEQDGVSGTFVDTTTSRERDINQDVTDEGGGSVTFNAAFAEARRQGLPSFTFGGEPYSTDLAEDKPKLETDSNLSTEFIPDPIEQPMENPYQSYAIGNQSAQDFGASGSYGYTQDPQEAMRIVERGRRTADSGTRPVERLGRSQQQGGTSGLIDKDRSNLQAEEQYVLGLKNTDDYRMGLDSGKGYVTEMFIQAKEALRQQYKGQEDRAEYQEKLKALKNKAKDYFSTARGGEFATPEMQQRFAASHDTIYNKQQPKIDPKLLEGLNRAQQTNAQRLFEGGGRTGVVQPTSVTSHDTGFLDDFFDEQRENTRTSRRERSNQR